MTGMKQATNRPRTSRPPTAPGVPFVPPYNRLATP